MRKVLMIITISAGIISFVSAITLGIMFIGNIASHTKRYKLKLFKRSSEESA